ncbi:MAG: TetR/AcrR family transcriptional regulator [Coriobacteriia bacterium]|nr:TetR/AcrR family transcriptional regulator [Coriobacteriia bacterium]
MPKQTFFNLPQHKQQAIESAALDEFAEYGFDASSMNRIVEQSRIAKGSFYQYFEDKKDLYFHLIDTLFKKKMQCVEPVLMGYREHSFSHNIEALLLSGLAFSLNDPQLQRMATDFAGKSREFVGEFLKKYSPEATDIYTALLEHASEKGELREGIVIPTAAHLISTLINEASILMMGRLGVLQSDDALIQETLSFIERAVLR